MLMFIISTYTLLPMVNTSFFAYYTQLFRSEYVDTGGFGRANKNGGGIVCDFSSLSINSGIRIRQNRSNFALKREHVL